LGFDVERFAGSTYVARPNDNDVKLRINPDVLYDNSRLKRMMLKLGVSPEKWGSAKTLIN